MIFTIETFYLLFISRIFREAAGNRQGTRKRPRGRSPMRWWDQIRSTQPIIGRSGAGESRRKLLEEATTLSIEDYRCKEEDIIANVNCSPYKFSIANK